MSQAPESSSTMSKITPTMAPVDEILFRSPLAAVNSANHLRVYVADVAGGIRECQYEGKWTGGKRENTIGHSKLYSPIAATSKELHNIRVYYISSDNRLRESCYDSGKGWYSGALNDHNFVVAPFSKLAACFLAVDGLRLRIYAQQQDDTIQEYGYDGSSSGWQKMTNLGPALPGSEIAATSYKTSQLSIRVYFQAANLNLIEKCYDSKPWYTGAFTVQKALPRTSLAAISFNATSGGVSLRVYYGANNERIHEKAWDNGGWYDGGFNVSSIPGSEVAAICWGGGSEINIRVYFQMGVHTTGVTEWMWYKGWSQGYAALPPA